MADLDVPGYMEFFGDDYLGAYRETITPENAAVETAFVQKVLGVPPGAEILDLCCGHARHAVLLAKTGFKVTGLDLSQQYLDQAAMNAALAGVALELVHSDMRQLPFEARFDAVVNLFTSFGYLDSGDEDMKVLHEVSKALKPGGRFLIDLINWDWVVANNLVDERKVHPNGTVYQEHRELNLVRGTIHNSFVVTTPDGISYPSDGLTIRLYTLAELTGMLTDAGFAFEVVYGGYESEPYSNDSRRMIVMASKSG
jgi:SAM-dependent methyltransferase